MKFLQKLGGRLPDFGDVVRRFPVAVVLMALLCAWFIYNNMESRFRDDDIYAAAGLILAGYLCVQVQLVRERGVLSKVLALFFKLAVASVAFLLCFHAEKLSFNGFMAIAAAILTLGNAAAWRDTRDDVRVWTFSQKLWTGAAFAFVGSVIFALGVIVSTRRSARCSACASTI